VHLLRIVVFIVVLAAVQVAVTPVHAVPVVRILFNGDSVTHGYHGDYSYRLRVADEFNRQGVAVDFVGSRRSPYATPGTLTSHYLQPFDSDHFALGGTWLSAQAVVIGAEVAKQQPDVVVCQLGLNDLRFEQTPEEVGQSLREWISAVRAARASASIVLMNIMPQTNGGRPWLETAIPQFNELQNVIAGELTTKESPIVVAHTADGWDQAAFSYDGGHANPTGETVVAQRLAESFQRLGILTQEPRPWRTMEWDRKLVPRISLDAGLATISWDTRALTGVKVWMRRSGESAELLAPTFKTSPLLLKLPVQRTSYEFRLIAVRRSMSSPLGPAASLWVRKAPSRVAVVQISARGVRWTSSPRATAYLVKWLPAGTTVWTSRRTTRLGVSLVNVRKAKVYAINSGGASLARWGIRVA
jgi:lysophospholipase L1-like esterase